MNLLDASKAQDWVAYDILARDESNFEWGSLPLMVTLTQHNQKERLHQLIKYYVDQDHDPNDLIKLLGWAAAEHNRYGVLKIMYAALRRYPPFLKNPDSKQHLGIILWLGMDRKIPDRRLLKMLKLAAMNGFTFHENEGLPKPPPADQFQNTRAWVMNRIATEQIEYRDLDTRGGDCLVSKSV